ncbi:MAG: hypothetical protein IKZ58_09480 [Selenomonadaceae bacterium]|nr:hypothetical protein [Selenomonadaceae bacterium]
MRKKNLDDFPQLREKIHPFYELKECVQNNNYDFVLLMASHPNVGTALIDQIR